MSDFKKLLVWQKAHVLALLAYRNAILLRSRDLQSLRSQIVRAAMSIPANIAEGRGQRSEKNFRRFLETALNSCTELECHIILVRDIEALPDSYCLAMLHRTIEVRRMLLSLIRRVEERIANESLNPGVPPAL